MTIVLKRYEVRKTNNNSLQPTAFNAREWSKSKAARRLAIELDELFKNFKLIANQWVAANRLQQGVGHAPNSTCHIFAFQTPEDMREFFRLPELRFREIAVKMRQIQVACPSATFFFDVIEETDSPEASTDDLKLENINEQLTAFDPKFDLELIDKVKYS